MTKMAAWKTPASMPCTKINGDTATRGQKQFYQKRRQHSGTKRLGITTQAEKEHGLIGPASSHSPTELLSAQREGPS